MMFSCCILINVDELLIIGNSLSFVTKFKDYMSSCFHMKDLGPLKYFLGSDIARNLSSLYLCQWKYTLEFIFETVLGARPASTTLN